MMRRTLLAIALFMFAGAACSGNAAVHEFAGSAMGTTFSVKIAGQSGTSELDELANRVEDIIASVDRSMSTYREDSELSAFNKSASVDWITVSQSLCDIVSRAQALSQRTGGAFDITVGPLVNLWGFGPDGDRFEPPATVEIDEVAKTVGFGMLQADCAMPALRKEIPSLYVDLSAVAKGYAVDRVAEVLDEARVSDYLVEIGGELRARGLNAKREAWAIAIETPAPGARSVQSVVPLSNAAMATSGDYRNFFEHDGRMYSHSIDPRTARPVDHDAASVTVVAGTAEFADSMATALLVLGPDDGLTFAEEDDIAAYFLLRRDNGFESRASQSFKSMVNQR